MRFSKFIQRFLKKRPRPERNLDQFYATTSTVEKRVEYLKSLPEFKNRSLLFLGDDDLTSLAVSYYFPEKEITVIDIDERILGFIEEVAKEFSGKIKLYKHDLRNPLPKAKFRNYKIIFFDPPYTPLAFKTWLQRALEACMGSGKNFKRKKAERLEKIDMVVCYGYTTREMEKFLKIQEIATRMGVIIHEKLRDFNQYEKKTSLSGKSDLLRLKPTSKVSLKFLDKIRSQFYTGKRKNGKNA